jgi:hypothetical protein
LAKYTGNDSKIDFCQSWRPEFASAEKVLYWTIGIFSADVKAGMPAQGKPIFESRAVCNTNKARRLWLR